MTRDGEMNVHPIKSAALHAARGAHDGLRGGVSLSDVPNLA